MKARLLTIFLLVSVISVVFAGGRRDAAKKNASNEVVIYAHDSFASEWGAGPALCEAFEKKTGIKVNMISVGDAVQVLSNAILEKDAPVADILIGLDNNLYPKVKAADILEAYKPVDGDKVIDDELLMEGGWLLVPYDWSSFAMIFDSESGIEAPTCLDDLTKDIYRKKIILMDPRTSTPGLGFAAWTLAVYGMDGIADYWRSLKANILTMAPGWSTGYGLFTEGEAPLVISYTTSPAYHVAYDEGDKFKALEFTDGHTYQTEGAGLMKNAPNKENAKKFLDFLISAEAQEIVPETQWMYPANNSVELPESFKAVSAVPAKVLTVDMDELDKAVEIILAVLAE